MVNLCSIKITDFSPLLETPNLKLFDGDLLTSEVKNVVRLWVTTTWKPKQVITGLIDWAVALMFPRFENALSLVLVAITS
jgi:hypothetical protein